MAKTANSVPTTQNLKFAGYSILPADTTTYKTLYTAGANDAVVKSVMCASTDTAARNVVLVYYDGTNNFILGTVLVPLNSGNTGAAAAVDLLSSTLLPGLPFDQNGKRILPMQAGHILKVGVLVAVTAAKQIDCTALVEEY